MLGSNRSTFGGSPSIELPAASALGESIEFPSKGSQWIPACAAAAAASAATSASSGSAAAAFFAAALTSAGNSGVTE
jgi:hypothetical protein